jgi:ribosome-associated translation inhibitor RaiA
MALERAEPKLRSWRAVSQWRLLIARWRHADCRSALLPGDIMQVLLNTDRHVTASEDLSARVEAQVTASMERFSERITRVEVHLGDENSGKAGAADKRCAMEARLAGRAPVAVSAQATSYELAIAAATEKLERVLASQLGRLDARAGGSGRGVGEASE